MKNKYTLEETVIAIVNSRLWARSQRSKKWVNISNDKLRLEEIRALYKRDWCDMELYIGDEPPKPEFKPLFPSEGEHYIALSDGRVIAFSKDGQSVYSEIGRTSDTKEGAELIIARDMARTYCLERINEVNKGRNGFSPCGENYMISWDYEHQTSFIEYTNIQLLSTEEYIKTNDGVLKLIHNDEFMKNWKIWKGIKE
jgi:hypothetical protein